MSKYTLHTIDTKSPHTSALDRLSLSFEYNISWADEKKQIKERTA